MEGYKIKSNRSNVIGVHIRQGNVNDWHRGYFYGDEWNNISTKEPESSPHFCCFEDSSKNLSACPSNIQHIEQYVTKMRTYPKNTSFFVCSDRIGCLVYLHQIFPNRIIMNEAIIEGKDVDTKRGFDDFICLGACSEIITSKVSSFSDEAKIIRNIKIFTSPSYYSSESFSVKWKHNNAVIPNQLIREVHKQSPKS